MPKRDKKRIFINIFAFFISLCLTLCISAGGIYLFRYEIDHLLGTDMVGSISEDTLAPTNILFCDIDNNVSYQLTLDFEKGERQVKRLYFDNSVYFDSGLSTLKEEAERLGTQFDFAMAVTETQHAAIIDYVGGVELIVDKSISSMCSGLSVGNQTVPGLSAAQIFQYEQNEEVLCLGIVEDVFNKWSIILKEKASFFKLLNLSENDFSYTDYIEMQDKFDKFR